MTPDERKGVFEKIDSLVHRKFFDPKFNGRDWSVLVQKHRDPILSANDDVTFEKEVNSLLAELGTSHTSFFNKKTPIPGPELDQRHFKIVGNGRRPSLGVSGCAARWSRRSCRCKTWGHARDCQ